MLLNPYKRSSEHFYTDSLEVYQAPWKTLRASLSCIQQPTLRKNHELEGNQSPVHEIGLLYRPLLGAYDNFLVQAVSPPC